MLPPSSFVRTEKLLASSVLFDNFNETRLQLLDRRNMVCQDAHFSGLGWEIDLNHILRGVDGLLRELAGRVGDKVVVMRMDTTWLI
jgi:hypothetical protein